jgi:hypothetical protein
MAKWYLFWILTIQGPDGIVSELPRMDIVTESKLECIFELTAKIEELELMLGGEWYSTHYYGGRVKMSGKLIGILAGCDNG